MLDLGESMGATGIIFWIERFAIHDGPGIRVAVFLKGCPLRCWWCHSPESQSARPELLLKSERCLVCGTCAPLCSNDAIAATSTGYDTLRERCVACGDCADGCPTGARTIAGRHVTVPEILADVEKDRVFIERSGGGVTFSGGEPLMQPEFLGEALDACRASGLHTAVETSGFGSRDAIETAARADLVLFDLKIHDERRHRRFTGVSNRVILENFDALSACHPAIRVRIPLIPGINDDVENLESIARLAASRGVSEVDLLPYHTAGTAKYHRLDRPYRLEGLAPASTEAVAAAERRLQRFGLAVHIGG